jgi:hypothetical protein
MHGVTYSWTTIALGIGAFAVMYTLLWLVLRLTVGDLHWTRPVRMPLADPGQRNRARSDHRVRNHVGEAHAHTDPSRRQRRGRR